MHVPLPYLLLFSLGNIFHILFDDQKVLIFKSTTIVLSNGWTSTTTGITILPTFYLIPNSHFSYYFSFLAETQFNYLSLFIFLLVELHDQNGYLKNFLFLQDRDMDSVPIHLSLQ